MIDEILAGIFGEVVFGRVTRSKRFQLLTRLFFGILGAGLLIVGAVHFSLRDNFTDNTAMFLSMVAFLVALACCMLFNVAFARPWRWPWKLSILSFIVMFLARILFGP